MRALLLFVGVVVAVLPLLPAQVSAQEIAVVPVISGLERPTAITHAGDGSGRLFVLEQAGRVRIYANGQLLAASFLDISAQVGCCGERGLLGIAFHPQYASNGLFYLNYSNNSGATVISRCPTRLRISLAHR